MFYNISFFFGKPFKFYTTSEETPETVTKNEYDIYRTGRYIKGEDGSPQLIPQDESVVNMETYTPLQKELLDAVIGLYDTVSNLEARLEEKE